MRIFLILTTLNVFLGCINSKIKNDKTVAQKIDSCETAVKFPNAIMVEKQVNPNYTGDLNNYWGDDTTKLDIKHVFVNGKLTQSMFYFENGQVQEEFNFKCQSLHGEVKYYYSNGKIGKVIPHKYGRKEGVGLIYDTLGVIRQKVIFQNDSIIGEPISFDENGNEVKDKK